MSLLSVSLASAMLHLFGGFALSQSEGTMKGLYLLL
jgi:hypothetical protein